MFAEIGKKYLDSETPYSLEMVVCNIGYSETQPNISGPEGFYYHHVVWGDEGGALFRVADQV